MKAARQEWLQEVEDKVKDGLTWENVRELIRHPDAAVGLGVQEREGDEFNGELSENELLWEEPDAKKSSEERDLVEFQGLLAEGDKPMTEIVPVAGDDPAELEQARDYLREHNVLSAMVSFADQLRMPTVAWHAQARLRKLTKDMHDQGVTPKPNRVLTREMQRIQAAEREQLETVRRKTGEAAEGKNTTHEAEDCSGKAENPASATEDVGGPSPEGGGTTRKGPLARGVGHRTRAPRPRLRPAQLAQV